MEITVVISISYSWAPDDDTGSISDDEYTQLSNLFLDASNLNITVLASTGDIGAMYLDATLAQAAYPATDPSVLACGGTSVGNITATGFDEFVWNDTWLTPSGKAASGATGGGISARFRIPPYQTGLAMPKAIINAKAGRGIPDVAGNASPNSGYTLVVNGKPVGEGGTSAVAPLYAGLIAIMNSLLRQAGALYPVGSAHSVLYRSAATSCRDVTAAAGPTSNTFGAVSGYAAGASWDACTGLGSIDGEQLLNAFRPLTVDIHRRTYDGCDPGPVTGGTAIFDAKVTGGFAPLAYQWQATNAKIIAPVGPKPWIVNARTPQVTVSIPAAGTVFTLSVTVTDPYGISVTHMQS